MSWKSAAGFDVKGVFRLVLVFSLVTVAAGCSGGDEAEKAKPQEAARPSVAVKVMTPVKRDAPIYAEFTGRTDAQETVEIRARVEGFLKERVFTEGGMVKKGDLLFEIEPRKYEEDQKKAQADLAREQAFLAKAKVDMERFSKLYDQRAISRDEFDSKMTNLKQLEASVERNKAALETASRDLSYTKVTAPISGRIGKSLVKAGSLVGKGENTLLAEISSTDPMYVDFSISEREYLSLAKEYGGKKTNDDEKIPLTLILADDSVYAHEGQADMADRAVDSKTGTLGVRGIFPNPEGLLKPGQFAKVRALVEVKKDALCLPLQSILDVQGQKAVYIVGPDGTAKSAPVTLGPRVDAMVVIESGVGPDDKVVVEGGAKLKPGDPLKIEEAAPAPAAPADNAAAPAGAGS